MNAEDFEKQLERQAVRPVPVEWRNEILSAANAAAQAPQTTRHAPSLFSTINARLRVILWPCPEAWVGLAAAWVAIFLLNYSAADQPATVARTNQRPSPEIMMVLQEQRKILVRLMEPDEPPAADRPRVLVPGPRGELRSAVTLV